MKLLVSVRSADEALAALEGGADLIDVKDPSRGPLGRADDSVISDIDEAVSGQRPISAAMGELSDGVGLLPPARLDYVKFGLARCARIDWQKQLLALRSMSPATVVPTAYADGELAEAPNVIDVFQFAIDCHFPVVLIDTFAKDGRNVFSWLSFDFLSHWIGQLDACGGRVALAGSLSERETVLIQRLDPAWLAVRGAACRNGDRSLEICAERVRRLKSLFSAADRPVTAANRHPE